MPDIPPLKESRTYKVKMQSDQGKIFDFFLNIYINHKVRQAKPQDKDALENVVQESLQKVVNFLS